MSDATPTGTTGPAVGSVVLVLGLAFIAVSLVLGLVLIAGPDGRGEVLTWLGSLVSLAAAGTGAGAAVQSRRAAQGVKIVQHQTNGTLDKRIREQTLAALTAAGLVVPATIADDSAGVVTTGEDSQG